jgi:hypothetical protein
LARKNIGDESLRVLGTNAEKILMEVESRTGFSVHSDQSLTLTEVTIPYNGLSKGHVPKTHFINYLIIVIFVAFNTSQTYNAV